jgi:hypothetical protein
MSLSLSLLVTKKRNKMLERHVNDDDDGFQNPPPLP